MPTKLLPPRPLGTAVPPARLLRALDAAADLPITLVIAPAGYGKSTLVASWLLAAQPTREVGPVDAAPAPPRAGWLSLDEYDQDPAQLLVYLAAAVEQAYPAGLPRTTAILAAGQPPLHVVLQTLLAELAALPGPLTLVLDDYHALIKPAAHQLVGYLLRQLPPRCRVVLLSRSDPPLSLARLRAEGRLSELRGNDLRLTDAEAQALLASVAGRAIAAEEAAPVLAQMEGWAIGLQLAGLTLRSGGRLVQAAQQTAAYLVDEVLARQTTATQQALLAMAVPERFSPALCAALLELPDGGAQSKALIEELVGANLFLISLDEAGNWYRYHQLFRDLLRHHLALSVGAEGLRALHRRAADWFTAQDLVGEALRHHLAAGDEEAAADLVERVAGNLLTTRLASPVMRGWVQALPPALVARRMNLLLFDVHLHLINIDVASVAALLPQVTASMAVTSAAALPGATADLELLHCFLAYWRGDPEQAILHGERSLAGPARTRFLGAAFAHLSLAYNAAGHPTEGFRVAQAAITENPMTGHWRQWAQHYQCFYGLHYVTGDLNALRSVARHVLEAIARQSTERGAAPIYALLSLGAAAYEQNDLDTATAYFEQLVARRYFVAHAIIVDGIIGLGLVSLARGDIDTAVALVAQARAAAEENRGVSARHQAEGFALRVALAEGNQGAARDVAESLRDNHRFGVSMWLELPELQVLCMLLAGGSSAELARADTLAAGYVADAAALHNTRVLIAALVTQALVQESRGYADAARSSMERAVRLGEPGGFVRTFADLGAPAAALLAELRPRGVALLYLGKLLAAFEQQTTITPSASSPPGPLSNVPELLTPRELEVLRLLAARRSQQEIADQLLIALNTVKKHAGTIYDKLGAHNRREAIAAAEALGLLALG